jgi:hypothetical protein
MAITTGMAIAAGVSAASSLAGGAMASSAAKKAARVQEQAARDATAAQERMFQRQTELQEPFRQGGLTAQQEIMQLLGLGENRGASFGTLAKPFGASDFQQDPGYAFRQSEGMKALERSAAARGNLLSGSALKGIQRFGQDLASQEYQNAFNRFQVERAAKLNPLQSLMGSGQSAANVMTGAAGQAGQNEASNIYNAGQARASGYIGQGNALNQALGQVAGIAGQLPVQNAMMEYYRNNTPSNTGTGPGGTFEPGYGVRKPKSPWGF